MHATVGAASYVAAPRRLRVPVALWVALRPRQWSKNLLVFAGLLFGRRATDPTSVGHAAVAFVAFCALSSAVYLFNDVLDREHDRSHPLKARRPIAAGDVGVGAALAVAAAVAVGGLVAAFLMRAAVGWTAVVYLLLMAGYSLWLKHVVILDVLVISLGFVLRAIVGAVAVNVEISKWLLVCTTLLALFLALAKRRHELVLLANQAVSHRRILGEYSPYLLDQMISVVTASALVAYVFYAISPETALKFGTPWLTVTIPFPLYGIFRYLYLVHRASGGGDPADLLLTDRPLLTCIVLWAIVVAAAIYHPW